MPSTAKVQSHAPAHGAGRVRRHVEPPSQGGANKGAMIVASVVGLAVVLGAAVWVLAGPGKKPTVKPGPGPEPPGTS